jgi:hypothetical protein
VIEKCYNKDENILCPKFDGCIYKVPSTQNIPADCPLQVDCEDEYRQCLEMVLLHNYFQLKKGWIENICSKLDHPKERTNSKTCFCGEKKYED